MSPLHALRHDDSFSCDHPEKSSVCVRCIIIIILYCYTVALGNNIIGISLWRIRVARARGWARGRTDYLRVPDGRFFFSSRSSPTLPAATVRRGDGQKRSRAVRHRVVCCPPPSPRPRTV